MDTIELNDLVITTVNNFIMLKLTKYGWFSEPVLNKILRKKILRHIHNRCARDSQEAILEALAQESTQVDLAKMISTSFRNFDLPPNDKDLLSFARCVVEFIHEICSDHYKSVLREPVSTGSDGMLLYAPRGFPFFSLPAEIRNMIYREVLVLPDGDLVRSFGSPDLLQANTLVRNEAMPIFYSENHFEITVKRPIGADFMAEGEYLPELDKRVWQRFLWMWDDFAINGSNCLRYIRHITVIYQLCLGTGYTFGDDVYDTRLGFRLSNDPFEEDLDGNYEEDSDANTESDSSDEDFGLDFEELDAEAESLDAEDLDDDPSGGYEYEADTEVEEVPEADFDPVGVFELNRGTFDWPSRRETWSFLWNRMNEHVPNQVWTVYPIERLTELLWRCARDCPLVSENVDFLCDDIQHWIDDRPLTRHDEGCFYDPDDESDWYFGDTSRV